MSENSGISPEVVKALEGDEKLQDLVQRPSPKVTPPNVKDSLGRREKDIKEYSKLAEKVRKNTLGFPSEPRNTKIIKAIRPKIEAERLNEQIRGEFGLPPQNKLAKEGLRHQQGEH